MWFHIWATLTHRCFFSYPNLYCIISRIDMLAIMLHGMLVLAHFALLVCLTIQKNKQQHLLQNKKCYLEKIHLPIFFSDDQIEFIMCNSNLIKLGKDSH